MSSTTIVAAQPHLLAIPPELREMIYDLVSDSFKPLNPSDPTTTENRNRRSLTQICIFIRSETLNRYTFHFKPSRKDIDASCRQAQEWLTEAVSIEQVRMLHRIVIEVKPFRLDLTHHQIPGTQTHGLVVKNLEIIKPKHSGNEDDDDDDDEEDSCEALAAIEASIFYALKQFFFNGESDSWYASNGQPSIYERGLRKDAVLNLVGGLTGFLSRARLRHRKPFDEDMTALQFVRGHVHTLWGRRHWAVSFAHGAWHGVRRDYDG